MVSKILVPLDRTELAEAGLRWAEQAARRCGAAIHLLTVVDSAEDRAGDTAKSAEAYLQSKRDQLKNTGLTVKMEVALGRPAETIIERAENVDLTVASSGTTRWLISAVLDRVLEKMTSPLVVVRASEGDTAVPPADRILVALDQADYSSEIIPIVMDLAKGLSAGVTLCHAVAPTVDDWGRPLPAGTGGASEALYRAELFVQKIAERFEQEGITTDVVVAIGDAPQQIVRTAQRTGAGLIALTTRGRDHLDSRLVGGTANAILHSTRIPCLLTRRLPAGAARGTWRSIADAQ
jgi:nucleotide-binding universal stress UspA family protein